MTLTAIATSVPHIPNGMFEPIKQSENMASVRVTPDPKWFMLAGRTFNLVCHDSNPCLTLGASALISASLWAFMPDHSGLWVLDQLKRDTRTRHIPVHVVSASDNAQTALSLGAIGYALKPVKREDPF